jgi:hypothetical protein
MTTTQSKRKVDDGAARENESQPSCGGSGTKRLRIMTDMIEVKGDSDSISIFEDGLSDHDSLFDEPLVPDGLSELSVRLSDECYQRASPTTVNLASRTAPPVPGLFAPSVRLPPKLAGEVMRKCMEKYFSSGKVNQVMLFGRTLPPLLSDLSEGGLPSFLTSLLSTISELLLPVLPTPTYALLFPPADAPIRVRQAILNLYNSGEGISPHVDLLTRFGDGIVGVSLGSGCVMRFRKEQEHAETSNVHAANTDGSFKGQSISRNEEEWDLYLPERSIIVLSEEARYKWTHGIEGRTKDFVRGEKDATGEWIARGVRLSITFRWLLPGADIVGGPDQ